MRSKNRTGQVLLRVAALVAPTLGLAPLLVVGGRVAHGSGPTVHLWIGHEAASEENLYITDTNLRHQLQHDQQTFYGAGLNFPDMLDGRLHLWL